jgi:hypothetical protein
LDGAELVMAQVAVGLHVHPLDNPASTIGTPGPFGVAQTAWTKRSYVFEMQLDRYVGQLAAEGVGLTGEINDPLPVPVMIEGVIV